MVRQTDWFALTLNSVDWAVNFNFKTKVYFFNSINVTCIAIGYFRERQQVQWRFQKI